MKNSWVPQPIDTSSVVLPPELDDLVEKLAENMHAVWGLERMNMGWTYGPERSDAKHETPLLVPYDCLPEDEKLYDRRIVQETLRSICYFGYSLYPTDVSEASESEA